jgi:hypothetical protein
VHIVKEKKEIITPYPEEKPARISRRAHRMRTK